MEIMKTTEEFIELKFKLKIRHQDLDLLVYKAIEKGGSLHWIYDARLKYKNLSLSKGGVLLMYGMKKNIVYELDRNKIIIGLLQAIPYLNKPISKGVFNIDSLDVDSCDMVIQLGLFNDLVF